MHIKIGWWTSILAWLLFLVALASGLAASPILAVTQEASTLGDSFIIDIAIIDIAPIEATVTWQTNAAATSQVFYDIETRTDISDYAYYTEVYDQGSNMVTSHSVYLDGLSRSTTYFYRVKSTTDSSEYVSDEQSFTTTAPMGGGFGGGGAAPPPEGTTDVQAEVNVEGYFIVDVTCSSYDDLVEAFIAEDTQGLDEHGNPLTEIAILKMTDPPDPPSDNTIIGVVYDFRPDGATFDPPITVTFPYDPDLVPDIVDEEDLTIAMWDEDTESWVYMTSVVDPGDNTISVQLAHFTGFTVMASHVPAMFQVSDLTLSPGEVDTSDTVHVEATLNNIGGLSGTYQMELLINGVIAEIKEITLDGSESTIVTFDIVTTSPGIYDVSIGGLTASFNVRKAIIVEEEVEEKDEEEEETYIPPVKADITPGKLSVTPTVAIGETATISVIVTNNSDIEGDYELVLIIDGREIESQIVTLAGNSSKTVVFTAIGETAGVHTVEVSDLSATFDVWREAETPEEIYELNWWLIGGILCSCSIITAFTTIYLLKYYIPKPKKASWIIKYPD